VIECLHSRDHTKEDVMGEQVHKRLTDEQVKMVLGRYLSMG
jgi:hypothetical protein